jgi:protein-S-isoprenylcysteine O-methyltransferase Ste14
MAVAPAGYCRHKYPSRGTEMSLLIRNKILSSGIKIVANVVVVVFLGLLAFGCYRRYHDTGSINWLGLLIVNCICVTMYVARRDASSISQSPLLWLLAFAGTCVTLLLRPGAPSITSDVGNIVQLVGIAAIVASMLSLRRSYGIVPANRGIRTGGLYNFVRHPLYASELFWMLGFVIANPSGWNIGLWLCDCALQFSRACAEERFLSVDPVYSQYRTRVKYRLLPLVI